MAEQNGTCLLYTSSFSARQIPVPAKTASMTAPKTAAISPAVKMIRLFFLFLFSVLFPISVIPSVDYLRMISGAVLSISTRHSVSVPPSATADSPGFMTQSLFNTRVHLGPSFGNTIASVPYWRHSSAE